MKNSKLWFPIIGIVLRFSVVWSQEVRQQTKSESSSSKILTTQTVRGQVIDMQTKAPLIGALVRVVGTGLGAESDENGYYKISGVALGRQSLQASYIGYEPQTVANILVTSGKEVIVNFELQEALNQTETIVVTAEAEKGKTNNEMLTLSSRSFDVEDTRRYAGSRNDPARMASNFAGVTGNNDSRNDIIIRGNSPVFLLWRLEGVDIFNPNHFGSLGATGGPVSMLNNNLLEKSDFMTAAFPAMYGNALAGVFDLKLRNGNNEKHEFTGQIGFNGFEIGIEGPLNKSSRASYLANYRYSALALVQQLGVSFGTGTAVPYYQDLNFKLDIPTGKAGRFTIFGLGGRSYINFKGDPNDTVNFYSDPYQNLNYQTAMGVVGASHTYLFSNSLIGKLVISASYADNQTKVDSLDANWQPIHRFGNNSWQSRLALNYQLTKKFNARNTVTVGFFCNRLGFSYKDSVLYEGREFRYIRNSTGNSYLFQVFGQWQYRITEKLTFNGGLINQHFALNSKTTIEPRAGLRYALSTKQTLSAGVGLHRQIQSLFIYYNTTYTDGGIERTNKDLDFSQSLHVVLGYEAQLGKNWRLKTEVYYQDLSKIPIEQRASFYSAINEGADFNNPEVDSLINKGVGRNSGVEFTLERYFDKGFYLLSTVSVYDSKYKGSDGVERNSAFNGVYTYNLLAGKEFQLSKKLVFALDLKLTSAGGRRYIPIDLAASVDQRRTIYKTDQAYVNQFADYFRTDLKFTFRLDGRRLSQEFFVDIQNIFNTKNIFQQYFDARAGKIITQYHLGLFVNVNYRINF